MSRPEAAATSICSVRAAQVVDADHRVQMRQLRADELSDEQRFGHGDEHPGKRIGEDRRAAANMLLDLRPAQRRIHRNRDRADAHRAQEHLEEGAARGQHERHRIAAADARRSQTARDFARVGPQPRVGDGFQRLVALDQRDVLAIGMALEMPAKRFDDRRGGFRRADDRLRQRSRHRRQWNGAGRRFRLRDCIEKVARRAGRGRQTLRQTNAEGVLDTQHELDARQAVEPEIALDPVVEMHGRSGARRAQLAQHGSGDLQQPIGGGVRPRLLAQRAITGGHDISIMSWRRSSEKTPRADWVNRNRRPCLRA